MLSKQRLPIVTLLFFAACGPISAPELDDSTELFFRVSNEPSDAHVEADDVERAITTCSLMSPDVIYAIVEVVEHHDTDLCVDPNKDYSHLKYNSHGYVSVKLLSPIFNGEDLSEDFDIHLEWVSRPQPGQKVLYGFIEHDRDYLVARSFFLDTVPSSSDSESYISPDHTPRFELPSRVGELAQSFEELSRTGARTCSMAERVAAPDSNAIISAFTRSNACPMLVTSSSLK